MIVRRAAVALSLLLGAGCGLVQPQQMRLAWTPLEELNATLPEGIRVYSGVDPSIPLRAWYVRVRAAAPDISAHVAVSADTDRRETVVEFAQRTGARVAINGGYFRMDRDPATHVGLLLVGRDLIEPALTSVIRDERRYYLARAALGFRQDGTPDIAWASTHDGVLYEWSKPPVNAAEQPSERLGLDELPIWPVVDAVAAGPALVVGGEISITSDPEVFFDTAVLGVHPRTAAGIDASGDLVLLVVDGRQRDSRGVDLQELATLMRDLGCTEAINLDGGGSSTLVVDGKLVNLPAEEREVMSALTVFSQ